MINIKPHIVARWVSEEIQESNYLPLSNIIESAIRSNITKISEEEVADLAEHVLPEVYDYLGFIADEQKQDGIEPTFELDGDPETAYIRACHIEAIEYLKHLYSKELDFELIVELSRLDCRRRPAWEVSTHTFRPLKTSILTQI